jgi:ESS family glutamate:Na+ symporter
MFRLDLIQTLALAGVLIFTGYGLRHIIKPFDRFNIPTPVIGGLLLSLIMLIAQQNGMEFFVFDTTLQTPLMIAFFTTIGFGASLSLLKTAGPQVISFFIIATIFAVLQNVLGVILSYPLGVHPLFGVMTGSVTLTGGPATGLAFAPLFEEAGVPAAASLAIASALVGITSGGLLGGPIGTYLIDKYKLKPGKRAKGLAGSATLTDESETENQQAVVSDLTTESKGYHLLLKSGVVILVAMWVGSWLSRYFLNLGITLPAYIGAMLVAAVIRNIDDATQMLKLSQRTLDDIGSVALSLFIAMALMTLKLWKLADLALPLLVILFFQIVLITVSCLWIIFRWTGRDYDSAVISSGFCGFMLGTTANAMANMGALVDKYGPAPRAFMVVPLVGAFFIDFTNALIITLFLNFWR